MGALLLRGGLVAIAIAVVLALAELGGAAGAAWPERTVPLLLQAGAVASASGLALMLTLRTARLVSGGRCARCGATIERGQTYCADHLRETVAEIRDRQQDQAWNRPRSRPHRRS